MSYLVGTPLKRGNNEEVINVDISQYLIDNPTATKIPQGTFVAYNISTGNVEVSTSWQTAFGIAGRMPYSSCLNKLKCQAVVLKSIDVAVLFLAGDEGNGVRGNPVYVDVSGKAKLTAGVGDTSIGYLLEPVSGSYVDDDGNVVVAGRISFHGAVNVLSGVVAPIAEKKAQDNKDKKLTSIGGV